MAMFGGVNVADALKKKYDILQQEAGARTTTAEAAALSAKTEAAYNPARIGLANAQTAELSKLADPKANLLGAQAKEITSLLGPRANLFNAQANEINTLLGPRADLFGAQAYAARTSADASTLGAQASMVGAQGSAAQNYAYAEDLRNLIDAKRRVQPVDALTSYFNSGAFPTYGPSYTDLNKSFGMN